MCVWKDVHSFKPMLGVQKILFFQKCSDLMTWLASHHGDTFISKGREKNLSIRLINKSRETPTVRFLGWRYITHQSERETKKWNFKKNLLHWILPASAELCSYTIIACSTHWFTFELLRKNIQFLVTTTHLLPIALTCISIFPRKKKIM